MNDLQLPGIPGHEVVPAWQIETPGGAWLILTRFDPDKPGQRDRATYLIKRFMAWKFAQSFVLAAETWLGAVRTGQEAVTAVGVSRSEGLGVLQRIRIEAKRLHRASPRTGRAAQPAQDR